MKAVLIRSSVVGIIALLALGVAGCNLKSAQGKSLTQSDPTLSASTAIVQMERVEGKVETDAPISSTPISSTLILNVTPTAESEVAPFQDGSALLRDYCARCHSVKLLERTKKSPSDWEKILLRMEKNGAHLSEAEKSVLIDHLTAIKP